MWKTPGMELGLVTGGFQLFPKKVKSIMLKK